LYNHHPLRKKLTLPVCGLIYVLALGYASFLVVQDLSEKQTLILWNVYKIVIVCYLLLNLFMLLQSRKFFLKYLQILQEILDNRYLLKAIIFLFFIFLLVYLVFTNMTWGVLNNLWFRFLVFIPFIILAAYVWPFSDLKSYAWKFIATSLILAFALLVWSHAQTVIDYPFSLSWSEGNRFYDYSMIFGKSIYKYNGDLEMPYLSPGRFGLWGIWFLIPNLPIWFHRMWDAILWIVPPALLGWLAGRSIQNKLYRFLFSIWITLFLSQGPIYAPILLAAILLVVMDKITHNQRFFSTAVASVYSGMSRWTWSMAPGMWGVLLDVGMYDPKRKASWFSRIWPAFLIGMAGSLPGLLLNWQRFFKPRESNMSLSQPLLWYRMFPNKTYSLGILLGIIIATGSILLLIAVLIVTQKWYLTGFQLLMISLALIGTFGVGAVISAKIGGGSNLHNFDMYFITLVFLILIYLDQSNFDYDAWPIWIRIILVVTILIPIGNSLRQGSPEILPPREIVDDALKIVRGEVKEAAKDGEVLFMDQRQLLTFGYISGVDLIPEYEKKYMMNQAMAGNKPFFYDFYEDLENKRFALIVSEPFHVPQKDQSQKYGEENNAYVSFVSKYVLCYYERDLTLDQFKIQLLVPREGPVDCE